ncbi:OsmC family protein [Microbacterium sp. SD291]|uniref:OsmC family protein n=1 Tax=Microbacterium sp. SD291 TaxID=2782007 RepID=UPI001A97492C|nr:OsmC family protein [Microbacterium sp. SD291]MBO0981492.1 OsmC family protein [Microbacterium sp. SD291]
MDRAELRALQATVRDRYTVDPAKAAVPLAAEGDWRDDGITTTLHTWSGITRAGLHPATGGDGLDACSGDMLVEAVLACAGVTLRSVATAMDLEVRSAHLTARSTFDARGTLGIDRTVPVGIGPIDVVAELDCDADDATLARLAASAERYCVVGQSLSSPVRIEVRRTPARPS